MMKEKRCSVLLRILNVSQISDDSEEARAEELDKLLQARLCHSGVKYYRAEDFLRFKKTGMSLPGDTETTRREVHQNITKFVKMTDQILSLASFLLKSEAFFLAHRYDQDACVQLPRTDHQKPFIPSIDGSDFPISVSHQWPFVGICRLTASETNQSLHVGLDIVVIEKLNTRLYSTVEEFVDVFQESFTSREWQTINAQKDLLLHEFYMQWSVKEAVSKALGVGLGFDFSSFEVGWDFRSIENHGLWNALLHHGTHNDAGLKWDLNGTISPKSAHNSSSRSFIFHHSKWRFSFLALRDPISSDYIGVACSCLGPFDATKDFLGEPVEWKIEWINLHSILPTLP